MEGGRGSNWQHMLAVGGSSVFLELQNLPKNGVPLLDGK